MYGWFGSNLGKHMEIIWLNIPEPMSERYGSDTVVATRTCSGLKPSISPSNVAQNANPGTVLETARPEDSKTPPTC